MHAHLEYHLHEMQDRFFKQLYFMTPELRELIAEGRSGALSLNEFQDRLDAFDLGGLPMMWCLREAFGLSISEAKDIHITRDYGSYDAWAEALFRSFEEAETLEDQDLSDSTASRP